MCGIFGMYNSAANIVESLLSALKKLEYRGYDSTGIAIIDKQNNLICHKTPGKLSDLKKIVPKSLSANIGIGHTRWATHGMPTHTNAHPICNDKLAIVHNGVIENYLEIKEELINEGYKFSSETDTEILASLISSNLAKGMNPNLACAKSLARIDGSFAIAIIFKEYENLLIGAKKKSPLVVGYSDHAFIISSDLYALPPSDVEKYISLQDADMIVLKNGKFTIYDHANKIVDRKSNPIPKLPTKIFDKSGYQHFMLKEIMEQPTTIQNTISKFYNPTTNNIDFNFLLPIIKSMKKLTIIACGSSYFAGFIAKHWFEDITSITTSIELASEFCYREPFIEKEETFLFISQSGETADTLLALRKLKSLHINKLIAIVSFAESSIAKEAAHILETPIGPEISVASTKSFTAQLLTLRMLSLTAALNNNSIALEKYKKILHQTIQLPLYIKQLLCNLSIVYEAANLLSKHNNVIFSGRGDSFGIALEGALKTKELSYIHAEAIPAGELKHGSIALIDNNFPVVMINPSNHLFQKTMSNTQEIYVRKAKIIGITDIDGAKAMSKICHCTIILPSYHNSINPITYAIIIQAIAYQTALLRGVDIDRPRNLAKSVTVE
ncbi:Glutamine--fructose-6-phosphate aminotransferase (isomerizing) [Candidatus Xenohaliotis californiensis]|uniref:Glutamine--fructose-6-phosphate aminotransferase [isomerizing] n=1 Tax=Candidatus Xenohaliotis californiensis TaxID=84677 RepID=A0ABP0ETU2_9RICK|nr:Glutamine--fructose-6-phosphate aminotransferase (isomerizing) [Candidatus Xenohaliotis californiensis]